MSTDAEKSEIKTFIAELRRNREDDRKDDDADKVRIHGKIDEMNETMSGVRTDVGEIKVKVKTHDGEIKRLRDRHGSSQPPPASMKQAVEKVNSASWQKIGALIGGALTVVGTPAYFVASSMAEQSDRIATVTKGQEKVADRAEVSAGDQVATLKAQMAVLKAQNASAIAVATFDEDAEKRAAKLTADAQKAIVGLEQRKIASRPTTPAPPILTD